MLPYRPEALTKRASLPAGGAYGTSHGPAALTGRASEQDGGAGTSLVTGRTDAEPPYTTEALTGRASLQAGGAGRRVLTGLNYQRAYGTPRLRPEAYGTSGSEALCRGGSLRGGGAYTGPPDGPEAEAYGTTSLRDLRGALITGGAYGTTLLTGRRRLRAFSLLLAWRHSQTSLRTEALFYGPEALMGRLLTGRKRLRDEPRTGDAYGTSLFTRRRRRLTERATERASLRDGGAGRVLTGQRRRRLRDEPPYADYGRRLRDEPPYGPEALTGRASLRTEALTGRASLYTGRPSLRGGTHGRASSPSRAGGAYGTSLLTEALTGRASLYGPEALTGRASLQAGNTSLYTGRPLTARLRPGAP